MTNKCKCGSKRARLQDFGEFSFVKCPDCQARTVALTETKDGDGHAEKSVAAWNALNPLDEEHPQVLECYGPEYLKWCERAKRGVVHIPLVEVIDTSKYRLTLVWPVMAG